MKSTTKQIKVKTSATMVDADSITPCSFSERDEMFIVENNYEAPDGYFNAVGFPEANVLVQKLASDKLVEDYNKALEAGYCSNEHEFVYFLLGMGEDGITEPYESLEKEFLSYFERVILVSETTGKKMSEGFIPKKTAKKVLWFSRHSMSAAQKEALVASLGEIEVTQINGTAQNVHVPFESTAPETGETVSDVILTGMQPALKELVKGFDEVAAVLPIGMIQQILPFLKGRMLQARNKRVLLENGKVEFSFDGWEAVKEVKIVVEDL